MVDERPGRAGQRRARSNAAATRRGEVRRRRDAAATSTLGDGAGLLDARAKHCARANRRDDDWAGALDRRNDGTEKNGASGSAQPSSSHGELAVHREEKSGGERGRG
jgi:hypothetical protein